MTTPDPSREAFGRHVLTENGIVVRGLRWLNRDDLGAYKQPEIQARWLTWQAAMAHKGAECWQPIETAPKDGTNFLALIGDQPYEARFDERGRVVRFIHTNFDSKPSHWAPLPAAPKQEGST